MITTIYCIYRHNKRKIKEHIYDHVIYAGPPPHPPDHIQTQDNPAYVHVELIDCIAYKRGLQMSDNSSPQRHLTLTTHQDENEQNEQEREAVGGMMNELKHKFSEDTVVFEIPV